MTTSTIELIVAEHGNDAWCGTPDRPLASPAGARNAIRNLKKRNQFHTPVSVLFRSGTYVLPEPFVLAPEDSGTEAAPIIYQAYPKERPVFSGGREITGWEPAEDGLWRADLPDVRDGTWYFRQLFVNGRRCCRARLPKEGKYFLPAGMTSPDNEDIRNKTSFRFALGDMQPWDHYQDAEVVFIHRFDTSRMNIVAIDEKECVVSFATETLFPYARQTNSRYWVENIKEGLTTPGAWFLDRHKGILFYRPLEGEDMNSADVIAPAMETLVRLEGKPEAEQYVEHVSFRGLTFSHNDWTFPKAGFPSFQAAVEIPGALWATGARYCSVEGCEFCRIGTYGIEFSRGCQENIIAENHIHDMGAGGVKLGQVGRYLSVEVHNEIVAAENDRIAGKPAALENPCQIQSHDRTGRNVVRDNVIHDGGKAHMGAVGIWIGQSGENRIAHNEVYDMFYTGISVGWEWFYVPHEAHDNIIEFNHIHDVLKQTLCDGAGIYVLGIQPGTILRNNLIHDVYSYDHHSGRGIYLDEGSFGVRVEKNIVYRTRIAGIRLQAATFGNLIRNNIIALCEHAPLGWDSDRSNCFLQNIVYSRAEKTFVRDRFESFDSVFDFNLYFNPAGEMKFLGLSFEEWQRFPCSDRKKPTATDGHSLVADPGFADPENGDFRLRPDSPAFALGFQPIETNSIGPRKNNEE